MSQISVPINEACPTVCPAAFQKGFIHTYIHTYIYVPEVHVCYHRMSIIDLGSQRPSLFYFGRFNSIILGSMDPPGMVVQLHTESMMPCYTILWGRTIGIKIEGLGFRGAQNRRSFQSPLRNTSFQKFSLPDQESSA